MLQTLIKNTVWRSLADVIARFGSALFWILLARFLGAGTFGAISFALALMGFSELVSSLGLSSLVTRDAAQNPATAAGYFGHMLIIGLASSAVGGVVMAGAAWLIRPDPGTQRIVILLALLLPFTCIAYWSRAMLTAAEKMQFISMGTMAENAILILLGLGLLLAGRGIMAVVAALALSKVVAAALLYHFAGSRVARPRWRLERGMTAYLLQQVPLFLSIAFFNALFWSITVVLITWLEGETAAGYYSAAYKLISYVLLFAVAFSQAFFPVAARLARQDRALYSQLLRRALHYLLMLFIAAALMLNMLAEPVILFLYGAEMAPAIPVLRWLAWMVVPCGVIPALAYTLVSHHRQGCDLLANGLAAATVVVINLLMIPRHTAAGGAVAMVAGSVVFAAVEYGSVHTLLYPLRPDRRTLALLASAALLALTLLLSQGVNFFVRAAAGTAVYIAALWLLQAIDRGDLRRLWRAAWLQCREEMA